MNKKIKTIIFSTIILLLIAGLAIGITLLFKEKSAGRKFQEEIKDLNQSRDKLSEELNILMDEKEELEKTLGAKENELVQLNEKLSKELKILENKKKEIEKFLEDFEFPCLVTGSKNCEVGDKVLAVWEDGLWYPAKINSIVGSEYKMNYYDGDVGIVSKYEIRKFDWKIGTRVECNWRNWGTYYPGTITFINSKGESIHISYDDGDHEDATISRCRSL